jgi:hypothetical protein
MGLSKGGVSPLIEKDGACLGDVEGFDAGSGDGEPFLDAALIATSVGFVSEEEGGFGLEGMGVEVFFGMG